MMPDAQRRRAASSGFTLIEVLVALAVLAMIVVGLSQGTHFGLDAWRRQSDARDERANLDAVDRTLRGLLTQTIGQWPGGANGLRPPESGDGLEKGFVGTTDRVAFRTMLPAAIGPLGRDARVAIWRDSDGRLLLSWTPRLADAVGGRRERQQITLIENVREITFRYWSSEPGNQGWRIDWRSPVAPGLIRIRLRFMTDDRRHWPDIVVAPALTGGP